MATADKLTTVAENVPKVYHAGQMNVVENAVCLKGSKTDTAILLDDISPVSHEMGVKVRGKNLFDNNKLIEWGFTLTDSKYTGSVGGLSGKKLFSNFAENKRYTVSLKGYNNTAEITTLLLMVYYKDGTNITAIRLSSNEEKTYSFTTAADKSVDYMKFSFYQGDTITLSYIQIEEGTTATAYTPYIPDLTSVKVSRYGKNLFNQYAEAQKFGPYMGVDISHIKRQIQGTISVSLKADGTFQQGMAFGFISIPKNGAAATAKWFQNSTDSDFVFKSVDLGVFPYSSDRNFIIGIHPSTEENWNNIISNYNIQIEIGTTATDYEPYISPIEYIPNADGTVNGVTSLYPSTTLTTDTDGVIIDCEYYKDIDANDVIERKVTTYTNPKIKTVGVYAFYGCTSLTSANFSAATSISGGAFYDCSALTTVDFPVATSISSYAFNNCTSLTFANFPAATSIESNVFRKCTSLTSADFSVDTSISSYAFYGCSALTALILRSSTICTLSNKNAFTGCTLINGTGGYIYVPSSLVETYKTATNWVTYASKFRALEDYTVDGTTTGALDESKVSA